MRKIGKIAFVLFVFIYACSIFSVLSVNAQLLPTAGKKTVDEKLPEKDPNVVGFYKGDKPEEKEKGLNNFWGKRIAVKKREIVFKNPIHLKVIQTSMIFLIGYLLIFLLVRIINRSIHDLKTRHLVRKRTMYILNACMLILTVLLWLEYMNSFAVFISVVGAGVALALQEVLMCIAGWFLIFFRAPYQVGDRIELGGVKGDVIDIRLFQTAVLEIGNWVDSDQSTGRIVNIPNSAIFKKENYNYNQGFEFIWNEIKITLTFESDWKRAETILLEEAEKIATGKEDVVKKKIDYMTRRYMIKYGKLTPIVYINIKDSGVEASLRYLTDARKRRSSQDAICRAILDAFEKEPNVNFAYTTYRIVK